MLSYGCRGSRLENDLEGPRRLKLNKSLVTANQIRRNWTTEKHFLEQPINYGKTDESREIFVA